PADKSGEIARRGDIADSYGGTPAPESTAPVVDLSDPEQWRKVQAELVKRSPSDPSVLDQISAWAKSQRRHTEAPSAPDPVPRQYAPEYTARDVVAPTPAAPAPKSSPGDGEWRPVERNDNRQYHFHGADIGKVKQVLNEEMATLINHTSENFKSAEK
ncbi:MAG TPA: hypothetical protein DCP84_16585, partial [Pseudomonas sp.]|nr:hypothetical protein [Pseudomonas sp.]